MGADDAPPPRRLATVRVEHVAGCACEPCRTIRARDPTLDWSQIRIAHACVVDAGDEA